MKHYLAALCLQVWAAGAFAYNPLATGTLGTVHDFTMHDAQRNRDIPLRAYLPAASTAAPIVLFSHGLGGSREGSQFIGLHWSARGYVAIFLQHPGSDDAVWREASPLQRASAMRSAASLKNFMSRVQDVSVVLDQLALWNKSPDHALAGRLDGERIGMSGHSFGAITTQAVGGQSVPLGGARFTDARIDAALAFSPSAPMVGDAATAFRSVKIPWMLMTGTKDVAQIGGQALGSADATSRLAVYAALPAGGKYEVVLHNAEHSAFTDRALPGETEPRNPNHHRVILALSTAFWDAHLRGDAEAKAWLEGDGPRKVMEEKDAWKHK